MKKQIITTITILLALPLIFAMYGGENQTLEFGFETDNCTIVPNVTEGIEFNFIGNQVIVEPALNFVGGFSITCYDWLTREEETQSSGGGGGYVKDWSAKCGYNKECLYGISNVTNVTLEVIDASPVDTTEEIVEPIIQEEKTLLSAIIFAVIFGVLIISLVGFLLRKMLNHKKELPEPVGFDGEYKNE